MAAQCKLYRRENCVRIPGNQWKVSPVSWPCIVPVPGDTGDQWPMSPGPLVTDHFILQSKQFRPGPCHQGNSQRDPWYIAQFTKILLRVLRVWCKVRINGASSRDTADCPDLDGSSSPGLGDALSVLVVSFSLPRLPSDNISHTNGISHQIILFVKIAPMYLDINLYGKSNHITFININSENWEQRTGLKRSFCVILSKVRQKLN